MSNIEKFLKDFSALFENKTRDNGDKFVCLNDTATEFDKEFIRECHDTKFLSDDFRYKTIESIIDSLLDTLEFNIIGDDTDVFTDEANEMSHEICDGLVDVYNHDLLTWLSSNLQRPYYIDEANDEGLLSDESTEMERIMVGQFQEISEIFSNVVNAINQQDFEETDEESQDETDENDLKKFSNTHI